jgi:hypothetical protein
MGRFRHNRRPLKNNRVAGESLRPISPAGSPVAFGGYQRN